MSPQVGVALVLLAAAAALAVPVTGWRAPRSGTGPRRRPLVLVVAGLTALGATTLEGTHLLLGLVALAVVSAASRWWRRRRQRDRADATRELVLSVCEALVGELTAGVPPLVALDRAGTEWLDFTAVGRAARLGGDVPTALRDLARRPGAGDLRQVAAAWAVAHRAGGGLADALSRVAEGLRQQRATRRLVSAELASAYATAQLMAALPVVVLLLGSGVGGDPVGFLLDSAAGVTCLAAGLGLSWLGMVWMDHIAAQVLTP